MVEGISRVDEDIEDDDVIIGIDRHKEEGESVRKETTEPLAVPTDIDVDVERELDTLEEIENNTDLLKSIAIRMVRQNKALNIIINNLNTINDKSSKEASLKLKEVDTITFNKSNDQVEVVEEDITTNEVIIKAPSSNSGDIFLGSDGVQVNDGYLLESGEKETFSIDVSQEDFFAVAEKADDKYTFLALGVNV